MLLSVLSPITTLEFLLSILTFFFALTKPLTLTPFAPVLVMVMLLLPLTRPADAIFTPLAPVLVIFKLPLEATVPLTLSPFAPWLVISVVVP